MHRYSYSCKEVQNWYKDTQTAAKKLKTDAKTLTQLQRNSKLMQDTKNCWGGTQMWRNMIPNWSRTAEDYKDTEIPEQSYITGPLRDDNKNFPQRSKAT